MIFFHVYILCVYIKKKTKVKIKTYGGKKDFSPQHIHMPKWKCDNHMPPLTNKRQICKVKEEDYNFHFSLHHLLNFWRDIYG